MYSILFLLIIILSIILIKLLKIKGNIIFSLFLTLTVIYFIVNPKLSMEASLAGAKLFFYSVLPTMFPFMVICNMIINLDGIKLYSKILGPILCKPLGLSYPMLKVDLFSVMTSLERESFFSLFLFLVIIPIIIAER